MMNRGSRTTAARSTGVPMTQLIHEGDVTHRPPIAGADSMVQDSFAAPSTVLIVEDETVVSFFIRTLFEERGMRVATAATAAEALELIESLGTGLSAAIIDVGLPDTPGDQLIAPIRAVLPGLPIVIATGFSETEFGRRFQTDERVRVIGKPFDAPQLWSALGALDEQFA
jgi:DNA-binding NtrC family response regulator